MPQRAIATLRHGFFSGAALPDGRQWATLGDVLLALSVESVEG
jgi:hypothetical protein